MSDRHDQYLENHRRYVWRSFDWIQKTLHLGYGYDMSRHDASAWESDEYKACDAYLYAEQHTDEAIRAYQKALLLHYHRNPHHWQCWVLIFNNPEQGTVCLDMPDYYILEMVCDWWSFGWAAGDPSEIFRWYARHKDHILLSDNTRRKVEAILDGIAKKLDISEHLWHYDTQEQKGEAGNSPPQLLSSTERSGGSNAEKGLENQDFILLIKGIRSLKKRIIEHEDKLSDPERYYPRWNAFSENRKKALMTHWNQEIEAFQKAITNREQELERRGYHDDK